MIAGVVVVIGGISIAIVIVDTHRRCRFASVVVVRRGGRLAMKAQDGRCGEGAGAS